MLLATVRCFMVVNDNDNVLARDPSQRLGEYVERNINAKLTAVSYNDRV